MSSDRTQIETLAKIKAAVLMLNDIDLGPGYLPTVDLSKYYQDGISVSRMNIVDAIQPLHLHAKLLEEEIERNESQR